MSGPQHSEYKEALAIWFATVPKHWSVVPCRALVDEQRSKNEGGKIDDYLSLMANIGVIPYAEKGDVGNKKPDDLEKCKVVSRGDLVINSMNYGIGSFGLSELNGVCSPVYIVLRPKLDVIEERFALRLFQCRAFQTYAQSFGNGILAHRAAISWDILKSMKMPLPPMEEQYRILRFLDRETAKIDALVEEQRRLIELLKEKRQAVISHAVTKGLDPSAPMKDSGVQWLGEVPAHWNIQAIWMLFSLGRGRVISHEDIADNPGPYPVYSSQTESGGEMGTIATFDFDGDYLTWTTDGANAGTVFVRAGKFNCTNVCGTLKAKALQSLPFFQFALAEATGFFVRHDINPKLMNNVMSKIRVPVPSIEEQERIVDFITAQTGDFVLLIAQANAATALLLERRAALISAAVTGKIDVRGLVPAEAEAA